MNMLRQVHARRRLPRASRCGAARRGASRVPLRHQPATAKAALPAPRRAPARRPGRAGRYALLAVVTAALLASGNLPAASAGETAYSCKNGIVQVGDSTFAIREKCGEPLSTEMLSGGGADVVEENWFYGGGAKLPYLFHVRAGKLVGIERQNR